MMSRQIKFRIMLWSLLWGAVLWFLYMAVVPSGHIEYNYNFEKENAFIRPLKPSDRVETIEEGKQKVIGDPVYFSLRTSRRFDKAVLRVKYEDFGLMTSLVEAGVLVDKTIWRYDLKPLCNKIINQLSLVWNTKRDGDLVLLQKEEKFSSVQEFLNNPPPANSVAVYNYTPSFEYLLPDYASSSVSTTINYDLRGNFQIFTYVKNEDLDWHFEFVDLNQNKDLDPVDINLYYRNKLIATAHKKEQSAEENGEIGILEKIDLEVPYLPEGAYKIELRANDDIVVKKIITKQNKIAFNKGLRFYASGEKDIDLYTDSSRLNFTTVNADSLQDITIGSSTLALRQTYRQFSIGLEDSIETSTTTIVRLKRDGLAVAGNGTFAFSYDEFFDPNFPRADNDLRFMARGIKYIIAKYDFPTDNVDGSQIAEVSFDIASAYQEKGVYSFIISIPGLKADDDKNDFLLIDSINVSLSGENLWHMIKEYAKHF